MIYVYRVHMYKRNDQALKISTEFCFYNNLFESGWNVSSAPGESFDIDIV